MIKKQIGLRIKQIRKSKNLSQEVCALNADIDRTYWASVENGRRNISIVNLYKIVLSFNMSLKSFFDSKLFEDMEETTSKKD